MLALHRRIERLQPSALLLGAAWAGVALAVGAMLVRLPLLSGLAIVAGVVVLGAAAWEPALGIGLALTLGTSRAYLMAARPELPDLGQIVLGLALAGWLARGLAQRAIVIPRIHLLLPLGIYVSVGLVSLLPAASLEEGLKEIIKWAEVGAIIVIVAGEARRGRARWVLAAVLIAGLAQALLGLWQFQLRGSGPLDFIILGTHYRAYGTFEQPNPYGGFIGLIWPVAAGLAWASMARAWHSRQIKDWLIASASGLATGLMLAALYVSFSRGAWLGAAAATLALVIALPRRWWLGVGLVTIGLGLAWGLASTGLLPASLTDRLATVGDFTTVTNVRGIDITSTNFAIVERLAHWQAAEAMARDYPWLGVGIGNYATAYPRYSLLNWPLALGHAHMIYLNVLAETGLLGLAAYVSLWVTVFALTIRTIRRTDGLWRGLAVGLLGAWTHLSAHQIVDNLYVNNIPLTLAALLGLLVVVAQSARRPAPEAGPSTGNLGRHVI
jgi:O-antigen ligase